VTEKDSLDRIVELARQEGALDRRKLRRFLGALRDRARLVLEERVEPLAKRADAYEKEARWRAEVQEGLEAAVASLEKESRWHKEAMEGLEARVAGLQAELVWRAEEVEARRAEVGRLMAEREGLREEWRTASATHDRLLAHHRSVVARVAEALETVIPWLPWSYKRARTRIAELAAALRKELP
jgi:chromosome segregation ATPase